jgi:peroxiredoxin
MDSAGRTEDLIGLPVPDLVLPSSRGAPFALRSRAGVGPLVLFFYIRNGTPG